MLQSYAILDAALQEYVHHLLLCQMWILAWSWGIALRCFVT